MTEDCLSCHFGKPEAGMIKCLRFPPTLLAVKYPHVDQTQVETHSPWMSENEWCGEWKVKK